MKQEDRNAIEILVARFFEASEDLIAVSTHIEELIERRLARKKAEVRQ